MERNRNIDLLKGLLIILVITGHIIQARLDENLAKFLIYTFHMPLFIGISGYLVRYNRLKELSFPDLIKKYLFRVIIPWLVAVFVYMLVDRWDELDSTASFFSILISSVIKPYYHLWFISAFLSWIVLSWFFARYDLGRKEITILAIAYSFIFIVLKENPWLLDSYPFTKRVSGIILHSLRPYYFVYFIFGMLMRQGFRKIIPLKGNAFLIGLGFLALTVLFYYPDKLLEVPLSYILNICLIYLAVSLSLKNQLPSSRIIEWIGINSLGIYLWHVMIIIIIRSYAGTEDKLLFYSSVVLSEIAFILIYSIMNRVKFINRLLFGLID